MEQTVQRERKIRIIPATKPVSAPGRASGSKQRVAAYCRVSTGSEEQLTSYTAQKAYFTQKIGENPDWEMAGIFADKGITGTSMKKRTEFKRMIAACKRGRIDLILTKSLSRFARNTVDSLEMVRMLRANGIGVIFEKENINTLTESSEFLITLFSGFAQAESESISKNVIWGIQKSREAGNVPFQYKKLLGYRRGLDGDHPGGGGDGKAYLPPLLGRVQPGPDQSGAGEGQGSHLLRGSELDISGDPQHPGQ